MDTIPPGKRLVPESERLETLINLNDAKAALVETIEKMPIARMNVNRSPTFERKKVEVEGQLYRVNGAIDLYSKPPVFVPLNVPNKPYSKLLE